MDTISIDCEYIPDAGLHMIIRTAGAMAQPPAEEREELFADRVDALRETLTVDGEEPFRFIVSSAPAKAVVGGKMVEVERFSAKVIYGDPARPVNLELDQADLQAPLAELAQVARQHLVDQGMLQPAPPPPIEIADVEKVLADAAAAGYEGAEVVLTRDQGGKTRIGLRASKDAKAFVVSGPVTAEASTMKLLKMAVLEPAKGALERNGAAEPL
jgi:hypothetical protein